MVQDPHLPSRTAVSPDALRYGGATLACFAAAAFAAPLHARLDLANIAMLFLLAVLIVAPHSSGTAS